MSDFWKTALTGVDNKSIDIARVAVLCVLVAVIGTTTAIVLTAVVGIFIVRPTSYTELLGGTNSMAVHLSALIGTFGAFLATACWGINAKSGSEPRQEDKR